MSSERPEYQALLDAIAVQLQRTQASVANVAALRTQVISIVNAHLTSEGRVIPTWP